MKEEQKMMANVQLELQFTAKIRGKRKKKNERDVVGDEILNLNPRQSITMTMKQKHPSEKHSTQILMKNNNTQEVVITS
jgi:hypothetical protein